MTLRKLAVLWIAAGIAFAAETIPPTAQLVAHEWGTFTSVADLDGNPMRWLALGGPSVLPCFVHRDLDMPKGFGYFTVRMETPVIYFYATRQTTLSVAVNFPAGRITEWYPQATRNVSNRIEWNSVQAIPGSPTAFPQGKEYNHYYEARATDSAPLRVGEEQEKLIFYRGVGDVRIPVRPRYTSAGRIELRIAGSAPVPAVIVFENRGGKIGFRSIGALRETVVVDPPELTADTAALRRELNNALVSAGLYPKEAAAMLATWHDSWFEEGMRVFYVAARAGIDEALPMTIQPAPGAVERVFVGRIEVLSPVTQREILAAAENQDRTGLMRYGRFLEAFWGEMQRANLTGKTVVPWNRVTFPPSGACAK